MVITGYEPTPHCPAYGNVLRWQFGLSDITAANGDPISFYWRAYDGLIPLTDWQVVRPLAPNAMFEISLENLVQPLFKTPMGASNVGVIPATPISKLIIIDWREVQNELATCTLANLSIGTTQPIIVSNSGISPSVNPFALTNASIILSVLPDSVTFCNDAIVNLATVGELRAEYTTSNGLSDTIDTIGTGDWSANFNLIVSNVATWIKWQFFIDNATLPFATKRIQLKDCSCKNVFDKQYYNIRFLDLLGSRSAISLEVVDVITVQNEYQTAQTNTKSTFFSTSHPLYETGGSTKYNNKAVKRFTAKIPTPQTEQDAIYIESFLTSPEHHLQFLDINGEVSFLKINLLSNQYEVYNRAETNPQEVIFEVANEAAKMHTASR